MTDLTATETMIDRAIEAMTHVAQTGPATWWVDRSKVAAVLTAIGCLDDTLDNFAQWFDRAGLVGFQVYESMATVVEDFRAELAEVTP
jgi:hypothetical protein